jgi:curved DNA-binding protein CbpA
VPDRDLPSFDCYRALGVPVSATSAEIEVAFRAAAKRDHPDLHEDAAAATLRMQRLNVARDWLTDPGRRARYDAARGLRPVGGPSAGGVVADPSDLDPFGPWEADALPERRGSQAGPIMASIALMVLITMVFVGSTSLLAAAIAVAAMVMLVIGATLTILGAGR